MDPDNFNHCTSLEPPKPIVKITKGEHAGKVGTLMGQWTYPETLWVVRLHTDSKDEYAKVPRWHFEYTQEGDQ